MGGVSQPQGLGGSWHAGCTPLSHRVGRRRSDGIPAAPLSCRGRDVCWAASAVFV